MSASAALVQLGMLSQNGLESGAIVGIILVLLLSGFIWFANRPAVIQRYSARELDALDESRDGEGGAPRP